MASITNLQPTTELEAVNAMLSAIGEAPISGDPAVSPLSSVAMALNILRDVTREVQMMGWRFNTEFGYELVKTGDSPFSVTDTAGVITLLNIFLPPANLLGFAVTQSSDQQDLDLIIRISRKYLVAAVPVLVFYDRSLNRDGLDSTKFAHLYIDPVWGFNFEQMPEEARRYCTIVAARQFVGRSSGSQTLMSFTEADELRAFRNLKREFGSEDTYNMLNNASVLAAFGRRPVAVSGVLYDPRKSAGPT